MPTRARRSHAVTVAYLARLEAFRRVDAAYRSWLTARLDALRAAADANAAADARRARLAHPDAVADRLRAWRAGRARLAAVLAARTRRERTAPATAARRAAATARRQAAMRARLDGARRGPAEIAR